MASLVPRTGETDEWQERQDNRDKRERKRDRQKKTDKHTVEVGQSVDVVKPLPSAMCRETVCISDVCKCVGVYEGEECKSAVSQWVTCRSFILSIN